jgi:hypothetical protein
MLQVVNGVRSEVQDLSRRSGEDFSMDIKRLLKTMKEKVDLSEFQ